MEVKSFDTILTTICDYFDELIIPRKIARSNTNIIYLLFKAMAKGFELVNNICVVLSNKFDPEKCSTEDLLSVSSLVGTNRRAGSASGLRIIATNNGESSVLLLAGTYTYKLNDEISFEFEVLEDVSLGVSDSVAYIAMSNKIGKYEVTTQTEITVDSDRVISDDVKFSCQENINLLGIPEETILEFRKRINQTYDRQNTIVELEEYLKSLPYIFDARVRYNDTLDNITIDGVVIPPMYCAIFFAGEVKNELAEKICDYLICPTVSTNDSIVVKYENTAFLNGYHNVNIIPFKTYEYTADVIYTVKSEFVDADEVKKEMKKSVKTILNLQQHKDYIKEDDIYNAIESTNISGFNILAVNLKVNNVAVDYVEVPVSRIPELLDLNFVEG